MFSFSHNILLTLIPGKRSEDPENVDWIPTVFEHNKEKAIKEAKKIKGPLG